MGSSTSTAAISAIQTPLTLLSLLGLDGDGVVYPSQATLKNESTYDYIVVGGGTAGCVVSTRLAEDTNNSVLLLEYGPDPPFTALAAGLFVLLPKSEVDYDYKSTYDPYAAGGQGNYTTLTSGKMLGGSASLNHLIHTRGCSRDFDQWANISGNNIWSYENFLQYFIKSERLVSDDINSVYPEYHGTEGPMGLSRQLSTREDDYFESFDEAGHSTKLDLNSNVSLGYSAPQYMLADKLRQTPAYSYLRRVKSNSNLHVSKNTRVTRVIFEGKVAVAVEAVYKGNTYIFRANKEIVLSAGVFNTPQILMLSGVGPKDHLEEMGINVIADLPVGNNYTDQVATTLVFKTTSYLETISGITNLNADVTQIPFPIIVGSGTLNDSDTCAAYQTFNLILAHDTPLLTFACHNTFWYRNDICDSWQEQAVKRDLLYTLLANVAPKSRGCVRLNSTQPFDDPAITTGFLTDSEDVDNMVEYIKDVIKVLNSTYFKETNAELLGLDLSECAGEEAYSDAFWRCYVKNRAVSPFHYTGTCAMGSVVDGLLRIKGLEHIRIVDASAIPVTPSGAPNAAVVALAELAADLIKSAN